MSTFVNWVVNNEHFLIAFSTVIMGAFTFVLAIATAFLYLATRALVKGGELERGPPATGASHLVRKAD
jgi:hypothetical protein